jgi:hypothetical protein
MATVKGTNYTKYAAPTPASYMGPEWRGNLRCIAENYTCASTASGTVIDVGILRAGEVFVSAAITGADLGSATTLQLGDTELDGSASIADDDRYLAATVFTTAGQRTQCDAAAGRGYKATKDMILQIKTGVEEATGLINVVILIASNGGA